MSSYFSILKSYHINRHISLEGFDTPCIPLIIKGEKRLFLKQKATRLPITKDILEKINENKPVNIDELNIDTAFKVVWAGFLHLGKIIYIGTELKKALFLATRVKNRTSHFPNAINTQCFVSSKASPILSTPASK